MQGLFGGANSDLDDDLDELGALIIDETPQKVDSVVVDENANVDSVATPADGVGKKGDVITVGSRGRIMTRSRHRAISVSTGAESFVAPSAGPPSKRSRTSSQTRTSTRSCSRRSCSPMQLPTPPSPKPTRALEDASRTEYLKKVELQSKSYIKEHSDHGCFGKDKTSLRPLNCVGRGGLSMRSLARWTRGWGGSFASDGGYAEGYFDADDRYYTDPDVLNPPKKQNSGVVTVPTGVDAPSTSQGGPSTSSEVVDMEIATADNVVATYKELSPVLRAPRSFESRPWTRLSKRRPVVKMNIAGIICNVIDDRDPSTGRMEDRRSDWTIDRGIAAAVLKESYSDMSDEEYDEAMDRKQARQEKKASKKLTRMDPQRLRAIHANKVDTVTKGDRYVGFQQGRIDDVVLKMAEIMVKQTKDWTAPRLDGQSRPSLQWVDCVDRAGDIDNGHVGRFSSKDPGFHPIDDITLIRAKVRFSFFCDH